MLQLSKTKDERHFTKWNHRIEEWSYNKFQSLEPYEINRDTEQRLKKVTSLLEKKYYPTHSEVAVGRIVKPWGRYKQNDLVRLNGNTRAHVLKLRPDLIPPVPYKVAVYDIHCKEDGDELYYTIDSDKSVENSMDKCTGLLREKDYEAMSNMIKRGKYKTAVEYASRYGYNELGQYLQTLPFKAQTDFFWDEIKFVDRQHIDKMPRYNGSIFASTLLVCKKYGINNERISDLIYNLFNGITTVNDGSDVDGAHYIYYDLFTEYGRLWKTSSRTYAQEQIGKILFGMDAFIRNEILNKKKVKKMKEEDFRKFYQFYLID